MSGTRIRSPSTNLNFTVFAHEDLSGGGGGFSGGGTTSPASKTAAGISEYATAAEVQSGVSNRTVTPDVLPVRRIVQYASTETIAAVNSDWVLHLKADV